MKKIQLNSLEETQSFAESFAKDFSGKVIALSGELGAGKTSFTQGFAKGLGIEDKIISPTFVLVRQHKVPSSKKILYHVDLYRLDENSDFNSIGLSDMLNNENAVLLIEWAERAKNQLPKDITWIHINALDENTRELTLK